MQLVMSEIMKEAINVNTEGVLVLASSKRLIEEFNTKEFSYEFPSGLRSLLVSNSIVALTTNEGDFVKLNLLFDKPLIWKNYDKVIEQTLIFEVGDELLIMNHAEFTMICAKHGDYREYGWPIRLNGPIEKGNYSLEVGIIYRGDEFEKHQVYFELDINFVSITVIEDPNQVYDIGE